MDGGGKLLAMSGRRGTRRSKRDLLPNFNAGDALSGPIPTLRQLLG